MTEPLKIVGVAVLKDNYVWLICRGPYAIAVDPGAADAVEIALQKNQCQLAAIVLTHHHRDHVGGVADLVAQRKNLRVYGPRHEAIAHVTNKFDEGARIHFESIDLSFTVIDTPGHTLGQISYFCEMACGLESGVDVPLLFCGDTLFAAGCGRLFEGTAEQMQHSLAKLAALPPETQVYCGHEYTLANLKFALAVEPDNPAVQARLAEVQALRDSERTTLPTTIALELETNPFLRWDSPAVRAAAGACSMEKPKNAAQTFAAIRAWKDRFPS